MATDKKLDKPASSNGAGNYGPIFAALRSILKTYESKLAIKTDKPGNCYLETRSASMNGRRLLFAAAKTKKNYVSFYLTPLYMFPDLALSVSPTLKKHLQGQSCFNFTVMEQDCFDELGRLAQAGFERFGSQSLL